MKVCAVGLGQGASYGFNRWGKLGPVEMHFVDIDEKKAKSFARQKDGTYSTELPDSGIDFAIISTPNHLHVEHAKYFLDMGAKVFIEKPPALSMKDIKWIEDNRDKWITVGFQCRFGKAVTAIRERFKDPILVECWKHRGRDPEYYEDDWHGRWATDGGVICQQGIHCVDLVCSLTDEDPISVKFVGQNNKHDIECEDTAALLLEYDGWTAIIHSTTAMDAISHYGGGSGLKVVQRSGVLQAGGSSFQDLEVWEHEDDKPKTRGMGYVEMWIAIEQALSSGGPPPVPAHDAIRCMKIVHEAYGNNSSKLGHI